MVVGLERRVSDRSVRAVDLNIVWTMATRMTIVLMTGRVALSLNIAGTIFRLNLLVAAQYALSCSLGALSAVSFQRGFVKCFHV